MTALPIDGAEFARAMSDLGPFEPAATVAVAVSGGADSTALALLARDWAADLGGRAVAATVDHGLREGSAGDARDLCRRLAAWDMDCRLLRWCGAKPTVGVQAAAREARYRLLAAWCREAGILHLLLGHHRDDQAETVLLRLARGSGVEGMAAMPAVREVEGLRLLRPLLAFPRARLRATAEARGATWIEDPANRDPIHLRTKVRRLAPALAGIGMTASRLCGTAASSARARRALDDAVAAALVAGVRFHAAGWAAADAGRLRALPDEVGLRCLARLLTTIGGRSVTPRLERLRRLHDALAGDFPGRTLHGCRIFRRDARVIIMREAAAIAAPVPIRPGGTVRWDDRFVLRLDAGFGAEAGESREAPHLEVGALGREGIGALRELGLPAAGSEAVPGFLHATLPALRDLDGLIAVPHLSFWRCGRCRPASAPLTVEFRPRRASTGFSFRGAAARFTGGPALGGLREGGDPATEPDSLGP